MSGSPNNASCFPGTTENLPACLFLCLICTLHGPNYVMLVSFCVLIWHICLLTVPLWYEEKGL